MKMRKLCVLSLMLALSRQLHNPTNQRGLHCRLLRPPPAYFNHKT